MVLRRLEKQNLFIVVVHNKPCEEVNTVLTIICKTCRLFAYFIPQEFANDRDALFAIRLKIADFVIHIKKV